MIPKNLEPEKVFEIFELIAAIPHGSFNVDAISDWIVDFAKNNRLDYIQDDDKNVIVRRKASKGFENVPTLILQGHIDMVCSKEPDIDFDFTKDRLDLYIDGDFLKARGTTLGADDGVAVAYALALLTDEDLECGELEAIFTVNEEVGLLGAASIAESNIKGKYMINIDSCEENSIIVSCAGGQDAEFLFSFKKEKCELKPYSLKITGLKGGHSGEQINEGLGNANKLLVDILTILGKSVELRVSSLEGGVADNVIPSNAETVIHLDNDEKNFIQDIINALDFAYKDKFKDTDGNISILLNESDSKLNEIFDKDSLVNIINFVNEAPNGVVKMSDEMDGLVETSLNFGVLSTKEDAVSLIYSMRSSVDEKKKELFDNLSKTASKYGADVKDLGGYPGWKYNPDSDLRPIFEEVFENTYSKKLRIEAIHAGLECGIFAGKINNLDCVSMGPDVFDLHTTKERLSISSAKRTFDFLRNVILRFSDVMKTNEVNNG